MRFTPHQIVTTALHHLTLAAASSQLRRQKLDIEIGRTEKVITLRPHTPQDGD
jgi:hypothetical protein